jgi:hypothetical protein
MTPPRTSAMKIAFNVMLMIIAAGVGLLTGVLFRGKAERTFPTAETFSPIKVSPSTSRFASAFSGGARIRDDSPLATQLELDLSMASTVTSRLHWIEAIEKAALADFPGLARLARGDSVALRLVAARWIGLGPRHLYESLLANSAGQGGFPGRQLTEMLFDEWPKQDLPAVIAVLSEDGGLPGRDRIRMRVAGELFRQDVENGIRLMSQWQIDYYGPAMNGVAKWAAANPQHAAEFALAHPAGYASQLTVETIGKEWARTDPRAALEFAAGQRGELVSILSNTVLREWAGRNLHEAADWLAEVDPLVRERLYPAFVEAWGKQDPGGALAWCESNLTGQSLLRAVGGVLKGAAAKDLAGAAALVSSMNPSSARAAAAVEVFKSSLTQAQSSKSVSAESIEWLAGLDAVSVKRLLEQVHSRWEIADPKSLAAFLAACSPEQIPARALSSLAKILARSNPSEALEWAVRLHAEHALSAGTEVFNEWRRSQPESAMQWLRELSPDDPRREPFFVKAVQALAHEPYAAQQMAAMTTSDRAAARALIEAMPMAAEQQLNLLEALQAR